MNEVALAEELVKTLVIAIVDNPDEVTVVGAVDARGVLLTLNVAPADMPRVLGRGGQTINAVRNVVRALGVRTNARYSIVVEEKDA